MSTSLLCQSNDIIDPTVDIYGLRIEFHEVIKIDKCDCCVTGEKSRKKCILLLGEVKETVFTRDTSVFKNKEVQKVKFFVLEVENDFRVSSILHKSYYATLENTCTKSALKINRLYDSIPIIKAIHYRYPAFIGLNQCIKRNFWNRLAIFLGSKKAKMKYRYLSNDKSSFYNAIKAHEFSSF